MSTSSSQRPSLVGWAVLFVITLVLLGGTFVMFRRAERKTISEEAPIAAVPDFSMTTQQGTKLTKADLAGKIWIVDFIFTRCAGPCPILTSRMSELAAKLSKNQEVKLVSVTVDPAYDTPEVLAKYAASIHANPHQWFFVTAPFADILAFTQQGMKQTLAMEPEGRPAHSTRLMVVDQHGMIRSYCDGNDPEVVQKLLIEIGNLLREHSS